MEHTASRTMTAERIPAGRLLRVGVLAAVFSAIANALVLALASSLFGPVVISPNEAVTFGQVTAASVAGAVGAAAIFAVIGRFARRQIRAFWGVAAIGLLLSFLPIALAGATGSSAGTLALMHVLAAATNVVLLTRSGRKEQGVRR
jgi:nitrate/nitrite transporter NarK